MNSFNSMNRNINNNIRSSMNATLLLNGYVAGS